MSEDDTPRAPTPAELGHGAVFPMPPDPHAPRLEDLPELTYAYDPQPRAPELPPAGVTAGCVVTWSGEPGPGTSTPAAMLAGDDGWVTIVPTGETQDVTITDDREGG
jgi:hypothetical protein